MACPAPEVLAALQAGALPPEEARALAAHLKDCASCAGRRAPPAEEPPTAATVPERALGQPRPPAPAPIGPGAVVGRYVVVSELGKGGMGAVYAAYDPQLDRKLALKLLHLGEDSHVSASEAAARLQREAQALARVSHPNTVAIYDVGIHQGRVFLAMEHLKGTTLRPWLEAQPRAWREAVRVCLDAGRGLAAVHAAGLVHRDFKPANVIVTADGAVKVLDFGLARLAPQASQEGSAVEFTDPDFEFPSAALETPLTREGSLTGTPGYIAPELLQGHAASPASDQFAFGITLHLALYGTRPFMGSSVEELRAALALGLPPAPPAGSQAPRRLYEVVRRCLEARPSDRFPSMAEVLAALARDPAREWRRWALGGATVAAVVLAAVVSARLSRVDCPSETEFLAGLWSKATRQQLTESLTRVAPSASAQIADTMSLIDERTGAWAKQSAQACVAAAGHRAARLDVQRAVCLKRRGEGFRILIAALGRGDPFVAAHCKELVSQSLRMTGCNDEGELERVAGDEVGPENAAGAVSLRAGIFRARALVSANRREDALAQAREVVASARDAGLLGFEAEALQFAAWLDRAPGRQAETTAELETAMHQALAAGTDGRAFFMAESLVSRYLDAEGRLPEARLTLRLMEALWVRLGRAEDMELSLLAARSRLARAEGRVEEANRDNEHALEVARQAFGERSMEAADAAMRLSLARWDEGKLEESNRLDELALGILEELKGPDDPVLAGYVSNLAQGLMHEGRRADATALIEKALTTARRNHREADLATAVLEMHLSQLLRGVDDVRAVVVGTAAVNHTEREEEREHLINALEVRAEAFAAVGRPNDALADCERAGTLVAELPSADAETLRDRWACLAMAHAAAGNHAAAVKEYQRALTAAPPSQIPLTRAKLDLGLARELRATHGDEARARELALDALAVLAPFEGFRRDRAEVQAFLDQAPELPGGRGTRSAPALTGARPAAFARQMPVVERGRLEGFRVGTVGPLMVSVFHESATAERLALLDRVQGEFLATAPRMYAMNVITGASIKAPGPEVRELSAKLQSKYNATTVASATVLTVRGLGAVVARGFLAGLALVARGSNPTNVFKTVSEATEWLQRLPGVPPELARAATLAQEIEAFIAQ